MIAQSTITDELAQEAQAPAPHTSENWFGLLPDQINTRWCSENLMLLHGAYPTGQMVAECAKAAMEAQDMGRVYQWNRVYEWMRDFEAGVYQGKVAFN